MRHGSLFSGIGGFDLAAQWMGWENVFHCENSKFCKSILEYYWPKAISYDDIKETDFSVHRGQVDIVTGGFPCQPYSAAGKRLGRDDERHLWPQMFRAIREIEPRWIVGENVRGLLNWNEGVVLDEIYADLEAEGYEVETFVLPAVGVNAPHRRERVWIVAHSKHSGYKANRRAQEETRGISQEHREKMGGGESNGTDIPRPEIQQTTTNSNSKVSQRWDEGRETQGSAIPKERAKSFDSANARDSDNEGLQGRKNDGSAREIGQERNQQSSRRFQSAWQDFPTQSPVCGGDDGIPRQLDAITFPRWRKESIMAYGNAIVPQVASQIFKAIELYESAH